MVNPKLLPEKAILLGKSLIIADLHIGLEDYYNLDGHLIPLALREQIEKVQRLAEKYKPKRLIVNGDLKHSFAPIEREFRELREFIKKLNPYFDEIIIVKGNHDTGINWLEKLGITIVDDKLELDKWTITHGHKLVEGDRFIIGHEHPAIKLRDEVGAAIKVEAFLKGKKLIVLPAFSPWAGGNDITQGTISPYLNKYDINELEVVVPLDNELLNFGELGKLLRVML